MWLIIPALFPKKKLPKMKKKQNKNKNKKQQRKPD